jgi:hypothetical protein
MTEPRPRFCCSLGRAENLRIEEPPKHNWQNVPARQNEILARQTQDCIPGLTSRSISGQPDSVPSKMFHES